jgi:hypothetical protein
MNPASEKIETTAISEGQDNHHQLWPKPSSPDDKETRETEVGVTVLKFQW